MKICVFLLIAGLLDAVLTQLGIENGIIKEGNPIMTQVIESGWVYFYMIKIILPLILIGLFYLRPLKGRVKTLLTATGVLYFSVLAYHLVWILLYLNMSS
ncbi:hypothetical protein BIV60_07855 [Bacillus sp. MUM 116]|uniref:DUF5658 family protein n=1 Tax=Bacillus sp. MUM 116 TaxID=1678002 RepID=UPI0008F56AEE|nr:DUF5658 family protein [Bacillus sp. MUM 116]OIK15874.1 hypothetical protein BIV60_07855 [Bacillus sp. MUM 116]